MPVRKKVSQEPVAPKKRGRKKQVVEEKAIEEAVAVKAEPVKRKVNRKVSVALQFSGKEVLVEDIKEKALADYRSQTGSDAADIKIYVKTEENAAYYVVGDFSGKIDL